MTQEPASPPPGRRRPLQELLAAFAVAAAITAGVGWPGMMQAASGPAVLAMEGSAPADTPRARVRPVAPRDYADSLRDPPVVRSVGGVLNATLAVNMAPLLVDTFVTRIDTTASGQVDTTTFTNQTTMNLRSYRLTSTTDPAYQSILPLAPAFPGPTFRVQRGDLVRIRLINNLPMGGPRESNEACIQPATDSVKGLTIPDVYQACFHGPNYTNIHYHGMHVTPDSTSTAVGDDVLMVIAPGDTLQYSFRIPQNQSPGTHWYHPHKHGSVAIQVANGMAGAFIVDDPATGLDSIVRTLRMREHLMAIQQVAERVGLLGHPGELDKSPVLVNGQYQPTVYMAPGEVQRWRIVNENTTRTTKTFQIGFADSAGREPLMYDIARDGVQFAPGNYTTRYADTALFMAPGQRLDVFVKAPMTPGTHVFHAVHNGGASRATRDRSLRAGTDILPDAEPRDETAPPGAVLFRVVVDSTLSGRNTRLPSSLPPLPPFLAETLPVQRDTALIVFTDSLNQKPSQFYLGSRLNPFQRFDDNSVFVPSDTVGTAMPMALGQTQTWKIVNNSQQGINHPFHIHINPFQVNRVVYFPGDPFGELYEQLNAAADSGRPIWLDVLPLPQARQDTAGNGIPNTAYAVITQKYDTFKGCPDGNCGPPIGAFVMHCHILGHEERGMMQVLEVVEPWDQASAPRAPAGTHPPAHGGHGSGSQAPGHRH